MIRAGIVGISGYSGLALLRILLRHPQVRLTYVSANKTTGRVDEIWPQLKGITKLDCEKFKADRAAELCDLIFLAVPHTVPMEIVPQLLSKKLRIIDLSGDYRLADSGVYKKWYGKKHSDARRLSKAVYGLPEIYRARIAQADLIANPGCYPTAALLALAPLVSLQPAAIDSIIIDAKSGVTGAGKKTVPELMFSEVNETFKAYKIFHHQHTPEIEQYLSSMAGSNVSVTFTPHLTPMNIGIYETIYVRLNDKLTLKLNSVYKKFYKTEPFVRIMNNDQPPEAKNVTGTNFCDIGLSYNKEKRLAIITVAIDNLIKGASGQAVQNMNIMCGFKETDGLA
ncbi:MAG: N-acetyl-gamma-glutamyl-phosphate reductase [Candidatus Omnitrophota bacterium]